jgi:AraC family L-rhamnose operon transcriptional activator RhaR/AraC family L-rhamnose operon regulatory protein RhaS
MVKKVHTIRSSYMFAGDGFPLRLARHENHAAGNPHRHEFHELVVLLGGGGTHVTDHGNYRIEAGDVFMIRGDMTHTYADVHEMALVNILFQPRRLGLPLHLLNDLPGYHLLFRVEPRLRRAGRFRHRLKLTEDELAEAATQIASLEEELEVRREGYRFMACMRLMHLLGYLSRCYSKTEVPEEKPLMRLGEVLSFMERNLAEPITVERLASIASMSTSTLTRRFRRVVHRSPIEHLLRLRVDRACRLLHNPDLNITQVAMRCGFTDSNYFSRQFKAIAGRSPRAYRRSL